MPRRRKEHGQRECRDHRKIEQDRRGRRRSEAAERIEDAAVERHQRHQQEIGKRDARELDRECETAGVIGEAGREQRDHRRREHERERDQDQLAGDQEREHAVGEQSSGIGTALLAGVRISRHERGVEGALGEDRAKVVGNPQRDEEGVGDRPGAEHPRQHDVARKAGKAREQREAADGEDASNHRPAIALVVPSCPVSCRASSPRITTTVRRGWQRKSSCRLPHV